MQLDGSAAAPPNGRALTEVLIFIEKSQRERPRQAQRTQTNDRPRAANLLTLPHRRLELPLNIARHAFDVPRAVDGAQNAPLAVVLDHRHGVLQVHLDALRDDVDAV